MKKKRKPLIIVLACLAAVILIAAGVWFFWLKDYLSAANASPVSVNLISSILGMDTGSTPQYSGIVEPQKTYKVEKDESKTVAEVLVSEGDEVHVGDVLFRYDTEELQISLTQAELDQEGIANQISTLKTQLSNLKSEKAKASKDDQYSYTVQIQSVELQIKQQEYESSVKKSEVDKLKQSLNSTDVLSEVDGVVKEVNTTPRTDSSGQQAAFISILSAGEFRVKGTVSELNLSSLSEGQAVIVHSRVDSVKEWKGVVESIELEPTEDQNNGMFYYGGMDSGEKSSKYNFYVTLESLEGLILGQHVYIEPDLGEKAVKSGLWLPAVYVDHDESGSFVWAKNSKDRLEKRVVTLGEYDSDDDMYEIKSGVTKADSIAYPSDDLKPGMPTVIDTSLTGGGNGAANPLLPETGGSLDGTDPNGGDLPQDGLSPQEGGEPYLDGAADGFSDSGDFYGDSSAAEPIPSEEGFAE